MCDREVSVVPCAAAAAASGRSGGAAEVDDTATGRPMKSRLTDCSLHGLGMMLPERVDAGQQVLVKVEMNRLHAALARFDDQRARTDWPLHPIFGRMSLRAYGVLAYKHTDHHLRQFGV
jgi:hypothetical protein